MTPDPSQPKTIPFDGKAHLVLAIPPWRMALVMDGIELNEHRFMGRIKATSLYPSMKVDDVATLIQSTEAYVQIKDRPDGFPLVVASCHLVEARADSSGLTLKLGWQRPGQDLKEYIDQYHNRGMD